jgi:hypothetical protein
MIGRRFERAAARLGFAPGPKLRCDLFQPPRRGAEQLALFDALDPPSALGASRPARVGRAAIGLQATGESLETHRQG